MKVTIFLLFAIAAVMSYAAADETIGEQVTDVTCPAVDGPYVTLLPNPFDCTTYYACVRGSPILMKCPPGLHFSPSTNVCDYISTAGCQIAL